MPSESFRFIHASDFHLETPLGDLDQLPAHLRDAMATAPRDAASAVLQAALAENIDFLVLAGDLLNPVAAGPHGMATLLDGLEKLHAAQTPVFWAAGNVDDPQKWPEAVPLPPNVTLFPKDQTVVVPYKRAGRTVCMIAGRSSQGRANLHVAGFNVEATDEYTLGVGYGIADASALSQTRFDYWALGGPHNHTEIEGGATGGAIAPGSPQGRGVDETGQHGYCVVDVDADQTTRVHRVACDRFRYCHVDIDAAEIQRVGNLRNLLGQKINALTSEHGGRHLLVSFDVVMTDAELMSLIGDPIDLLRNLRRDHGQGNPTAWTTRLTVRPPKSFPTSWQDEDTILGDFLRAAKKFRGGEQVSVMAYTEEHEDLNTATASLLGDIPANTRSEILDDATLLGVELLRGGKPAWGQKS